MLQRMYTIQQRGSRSNSYAHRWPFLAMRCSHPTIQLPSGSANDAENFKHRAQLQCAMCAPFLRLGEVAMQVRVIWFGFMPRQCLLWTIPLLPGCFQPLVEACTFLGFRHLVRSFSSFSPRSPGVLARERNLSRGLVRSYAPRTSKGGHVSS